MTQNEIRQSFLDFFKSKEHLIVPSAPVIPQGDPTLLFTNAGMNQFKDIFLGLGKPAKPRVADSQKCIRVSGKHNDLEEVGVDTYHHTFFEMLGNWSFGNYYKKEAISWAWELLTVIWKLPKDKLYATVHDSDDEAMALWKSVTDINPEQVLKFGNKDNFWEMGETGPCGPCTEIHIDLGPEVDSDPKAWVNSGSPRFREIWNLVFIQYNRKPDGGLDELKDKHVDTGMGFERIVSIIQGHTSNYDSDIFMPIIREIENLSGVKYEKEADKIAMRVIADHLRALSFSIADGVVPSNEGRGYVLRRVLRRGLRYGRNLGLKEPFIYKLVSVLAREMGAAYPELNKSANTITQVLKGEEESFNRTLDKGLELFTDLKTKTLSEGNNEINGQEIFTLYDTYGFPFDLTALLARENNLSVDQIGFESAMEAQREKSRAKVVESVFEIQELLKTIPVKTHYQGEVETQIEGKLLAIFKDKKEASRLSEGESACLIFDKSIFYAEGGGQQGDRGLITFKEGSFRVEDVKKMEGYFLHLGVVNSGAIKQNESGLMQRDDKRRVATRKNHSATHLLQKALQTLLGDHIKQAGSLVGPEKLRFDFNHFKALTDAEKNTIEEMVNVSILQNYPVQITEMKKVEAEKLGAMAFFGEKYGDVVRVVDMGSYSIELCGGSHVRSTGEIGSFRILSESSSASGVRRIEAITGLNAFNQYQQDKTLLTKLATLIQVSDVEKLGQKLESLLERNKILEKKLEEQQIQTLTEIVKKTPVIKIKSGGELIFAEITGYTMDDLRLVVDRLKANIKETVIFLISQHESKLSFVCAVSPDLTKLFQAGKLVKLAAELTGGAGGGRPDFAQAGGKDFSKLKEVRVLVEKALGNN